MSCACIGARPALAVCLKALCVRPLGGCSGAGFGEQHLERLPIGEAARAMKRGELGAMALGAFAWRGC